MTVWPPCAATKSLTFDELATERRLPPIKWEGTLWCFGASELNFDDVLDLIAGAPLTLEVPLVPVDTMMLRGMSRDRRQDLRPHKSGLFKHQIHGPYIEEPSGMVRIHSDTPCTGCAFVVALSHRFSEAGRAKVMYRSKGEMGSKGREGIGGK